jgi:hypothetical protein
MIKRDNKGRFLKGSSNAWNKGIKVQCNTGKTHFKKGNKLTLGKSPWNKGKKRPEMYGNKLNWRGGTTLLSNNIRSSEKYKLWRSRVFERDNWTCQTCGKRGSVVLEAHHKKQFIKIIREHNIKTFFEAMNCDELWDINNGVTLCYDCHQLTKPGKIINGI